MNKVASGRFGLRRHHYFADGIKHDLEVRIIFRSSAGLRAVISRSFCLAPKSRVANATAETAI